MPVQEKSSVKYQLWYFVFPEGCANLNAAFVSSSRQGNIEMTFIQGDLKVTQPIPDACSICLKNKLHWNQKTKNSVMLSVGNVHRAHPCKHAVFFRMFYAARWRVSAVTGNCLPDERLSICSAQENCEICPWTHSDKLSKNEMPGSVRQWTLVALVKKTSMQFDCLKTTDRLAWAGYNVTWPAWAVLQSQRYFCVFINPFELYWISVMNKYFNVVCGTFRAPCV
jgi:hypothetical protein